MYNCKYCSEYHLNSHERIDDCCLGPDDTRKDCFTCNENLKPKNKETTRVYGANCKYCSEYHLNSNERIDDCCLGPNDTRKDCFTCNEKLKPKN